MAGAIVSSGSVSHCTPMRVVELVHRFFAGPPDVDPCDNEGSIVGAKNRVWLPDLAERVFDLPLEEQRKIVIGDGLKVEWHGKTFVNPPYGKELKAWFEKCAAEAERGVEIVLLAPSYTSLMAWHDTVLLQAQAVCFVRGRLKFHGAKHGAHFASQLVYYGKRPHRFAQVFNEIGHTVWL